MWALKFSDLWYHPLPVSDSSSFFNQNLVDVVVNPAQLCFNPKVQRWIKSFLSWIKLFYSSVISSRIHSRMSGMQDTLTGIHVCKWYCFCRRSNNTTRLQWRLFTKMKVWQKPSVTDLLIAWTRVLHCFLQVCRRLLLFDFLENHIFPAIQQKWLKNKGVFLLAFLCEDNFFPLCCFMKRWFLIPLNDAQL